MTETLGAFLKARRRDLRLSLRKVEAMTGGKLSNALLSQIESGRVKSPSFTVVMLLAAVYALDSGGLYRLSRGEPYEDPLGGLCPTCGGLT